MTQTEQILCYLRQGNTITSLEALDMFGCMRLGARIWELIHKHQIDVRSEMIMDNATGKHYAQYYIPRQPLQQEFDYRKPETCQKA